MLTLFHAPWSRSSRLVWLVEELGADCRIEYCDISRMDGTGTADPKNPHPDSKVPALLHDGALITESAAVALYLTGLHPAAGLGFPPDSPQRGWRRGGSTAYAASSSTTLRCSGPIRAARAPSASR